MKIFVPVKRTVDAYVAIRVKSDKTGVVTENVKMSMNPFCEVAVEQAIRLKEAGSASEAIAVTVGVEAAQDVLRTALAMGVDRAIHIKAPENLEPLAIAKIFREIVKKEGISLTIMGKQAIDGDNNQTGQMLAALLGWPQATFISKMELKDKKIMVTREIDGGLQDLELDLPSILTVDLRLNDPRYASLPNIMKARKKEIEALEVESFNIDVTPRVSVLQVVDAPKREAGIKVGNAGELVKKLKEEAKVI